MAVTTVVRYVRTSSATDPGTGATAGSANTDSSGDNTHAFQNLYQFKGWQEANYPDLTTGDGYILHCKCSVGSGTAADPLGSHPSFNANFSSATSSSTCYIIIEGTDDYGGTYNTSTYRIEWVGSAGAIAFSSGYHQVKNIQVGVSHSSGYGAFGIHVGNGSIPGVLIEKCVIKCLTDGDTVEGALGIKVQSSSATGWTVRNCLVYDFDSNAGNGSYGLYDYSGATKFLNNTVVNCYRGIGNAYETSGKCRNNLVSGCTDSFYNTFTDADYNYSSTGDATGAHSINTGSVTFVDAAGDDYHLSPNDTVVRGLGVDLSATDGFSDDIDGDTRSGNWDIGCDQYVSSSPYRSIAEHVSHGSF